MSFLGLDDNIRGYISQFLPISSYASLSMVNQDMYRFCNHTDQGRSFWKNVYHSDYSLESLEATPKQPNPWKGRIKEIEEKISEQILFSRKFRVCIDYQCDKLGSLQKQLPSLPSDLLTVCLRNLTNKKQQSQEWRIGLATKLLHAGADPMKVTIQYLEDYPLRVALLYNQPDLQELFLQFVPHDPTTHSKVQDLVNEIKNHAKLNVDTKIVEKWLLT